MGLFGGSSTTTSNESFDSGPSKFQLPYLKQSFDSAQGIYNASKDTPYYQGDTYAGMSPEAKQALDGLSTYAYGTGLNTANTMSSIGSNLAGYANQAGGMIDKYVGMAGEDAASANMNAAGKYASNPYIQAQIDANSRDVTRNLSEDILPGIDRAASAGGNINSSRAGIASGIAQRGAADRISDISASIRGDAWNRGLTMAQQDRQNQMSAYRDAAGAYGNLGSMGMDAMGRGMDAAYGAYGQINGANSMEQADRQGYTDQDFQKWQGEDTRAWDLLDRYNGTVASNQWGQSGTSSSTSKTKNKGSILGSIMGAASTAAGVATAFSDRRLKKNIKQIGKLEDGLGIYTWTYIWEPNLITHTGVMADEVEKLRPQALGPTILGFQTVDYSAL